jgi:hypothetical protein
VFGLELEGSSTLRGAMDRIFSRVAFVAAVFVLLFGVFCLVQTRRAPLRHSNAIVAGRDVGMSKISIIASGFPNGGTILSVNASVVAKAKEGDFVCVRWQKYFPLGVVAALSNEGNCHE